MVQGPDDRIFAIDGFSRPEAVRYDPGQDVYFVGNFNGDSGERDANGFISRVGAEDGVVEELRFMEGVEGAPLHAPRGMFITGDTLWAADIDGVHAFHRGTGEHLAFADLSAFEPGFLNDVAAGPDGAVYVTDTGRSAVYLVSGGGAEVLADTAVGGPNGITWDGEREAFVLAPWRPGHAVHLWRPGEAPEALGASTPGRMDGVEPFGGALLMASQTDSTLQLLDARRRRLVVRVAGSPGEAVERGDIVAPRVLSSRNPIGITGGHCDVTGFKPGVLETTPHDGVADGPWEVVEAVRYQIKHGAKVIKTCATAGVLSMEGPVGAQQYSSEELVAMVEEAERHGLKVAAHAHGSDGILAAVRAGVASIEHGSVLTDEIMAGMIERGTYLVPTTYLADRIPLDALPPLVRSKAEQVLPVMRRSLERAIAAGVPIAFGTDAGVYPHGENAGEFEIYVKLGMSPTEALRTATVHAADLLGTDDRGVLAEGMLADIIAVPGNPVEDISVTKDVRFVMQGGRVLKHMRGGMDMHSMEGMRGGGGAHSMGEAAHRGRTDGRR